MPHEGQSNVRKPVVEPGSLSSLTSVVVVVVVVVVVEGGVVGIAILVAHRGQVT